MKNPFRKVTIEEIRISPQYAKYDSNFIETKKYETRYITYWLRENWFRWSLNLNPIAWLIYGIYKVGEKLGFWKMEDC